MARRSPQAAQGRVPKNIQRDRRTRAWSFLVVGFTARGSELTDAPGCPDSLDHAGRLAMHNGPPERRTRAPRNRLAAWWAAWEGTAAWSRGARTRRAAVSVPLPERGAWDDRFLQGEYKFC